MRSGRVGGGRGGRLGRSFEGRFSISIMLCWVGFCLVVVIDWMGKGSVGEVNRKGDGFWLGLLVEVDERRMLMV